MKTQSRKYVGCPCLTRGHYGERVEEVHRIEYNPATNTWEANVEGDSWGVWDSTFGYLPWFRITEEELGGIVDGA